MEDETVIALLMIFCGAVFAMVSLIPALFSRFYSRCLQVAPDPTFPVYAPKQGMESVIPFNNLSLKTRPSLG
jgi:hypothetical protein